MMNKPMMGQQPTPAAPGQPPSLNFQSDPSMRSQFKGFMSGMAARNMPAPQPQPAMMMPTMPQQMSSVDIFQPVMGFARGGGVGRSDYEGAPISGVTGSVAGSTTSDAGSIGSFTDYGEDQRSEPNIVSQISQATRPAITQLYDQGIAALQNIFRNDAQADQLAAADANMGTQPSGDALSGLVADNLQKQNILRQINNAEQMAALENKVQSVISDAVAGADTNLLNADIFAAEDADRLAQRQAAEEITRRGGVVNVDPVTGEVTAQVTGPAPRPTGPQFDNLGAMGEGFPSSIPTPMSRPSTLIDYSDPTQVPRDMPSAPPPRPTSPRNMGAASPYDMVPVETPVGYDEVGTQVPAQQASQMESILDRAARKDVGSGQRMNVVTQGRGAGMAPMDQIEMRSETDLFDKRAPGMGGMIQEGLNKIAQGVSGKVLEKVQAGGTPVYDANNQIVGVYDQSGLFGGTVYTGLPGFENPALARQISAQPGNESAFSRSETAQNLRNVRDDMQDAGSSFLKLLGFEKGGEVANFFNGGAAGDLDAFGGAGASVEDITSGAKSASGQDLSYAGGSDDNDSQTIMATPMGSGSGDSQTIMATPTPPEQVPDVVTPQSQDTQQVVSPTDKLTIRDRIEAVEATAKPSFGELAADLLDVGDLLSAYQDAGMTAQPTMSPAAASVLGYQGPVGTTSVPVAAQYESIVPQAAGIQQGIQGLQNVSTKGQSGFSLPSMPSFSQIGQAIMGTKPTYDNLTRAR